MFILITGIIFAAFLIYIIVTSETKVITITKEINTQGQIVKTTESKKIRNYWDNLDLSSRLAIPILIDILGLYFQDRKNKRDQAQEEIKQKIAQDNLSEEAIQIYIKNISELLLNEEHKKELFVNINEKFNIFNNDNAVRNLARIITITILRRLEGDKERQKRIINFLQDANIYEFIFENADLSKIVLKEVILEEANFQKARLEGANLQKTFLLKANFQEAALWAANLEKAKLGGANLQKARLSEANLQEVKLGEANLQEAMLDRANLQEERLDRAKLQKAMLTEANLQGVMLFKADVEKAIIWKANIKKAILSETKNLTNKQIKLACFWEEAIYKNKEDENKKFIEKLKQDKSSDPKQPIDCSIWQ